MHKFNNDWLFYREKIDSISRNKKIIEKINRYFKDYKILSIADLGCGTGSNYRYMYPKIKVKQKWDMIDISFESIKEFKKITANTNKIININYKKFDLIKDIKKFKFENYDLITGSAYLDIMPKEWFYEFKKQNLNTKVIYFSINYDGYFKFYPKHKDDEYVLQLFNKDQESDKGIGKKAVGKNCSQIINKVFTKTHKTFVLNSNWNVSKNKIFQDMFINFCENVIKKNKISLEPWIKFRRENIRLNKSKLLLRNKDFLALKL